MNAPRRNFMSLEAGARTARLVGGVAAASLLSACVGHIASTRVDPHSPIAPVAAKLARADKDYPRFSEIPPAPKDVLPVRIFGQRASALETARNQLDTATAPNTWTLNNSETFAAKARREAGPDFSRRTPADTESFARDARRRATPPPPARR
jgi:hypothetical protein